jgi:hypothetical protein
VGSLGIGRQEPLLSEVEQHEADRIKRGSQDQVRSAYASCLLLAQSGHANRAAERQLSEIKRTRYRVVVISAYENRRQREERQRRKQFLIVELEEWV